MKNSDTTKFEIYVWVVIILATSTIFFFPWYVAENVFYYLLIIVTIASTSLYLKSRRLYLQSEKKTRELLKKQKENVNREKTIDLIFQHSEDGILLLDEDQNILNFSPGMEKITGYKKEDVIGLSAQEILKFRGDANNSLLPDLMFIRAKMNNRPYTRNTLVTKDGREITIEASCTLTSDPKTHMRTGIAIIRDVTYEEELIKRDKEFIAITSHQMNTPLSIIRGYVSLLRNEKAGKVTQAQKKYLDEIYSGVVRMISITSRLLSISRIEQDKIKLEKEDISLIELSGSLHNYFKNLALENKINLVFSNDQSDSIIYADREKLFQALSNLIDNAIKYSPKGKVEVSTKETKDQAIISIKDNGIGIPANEIENVGRKFYRSQSAINSDSKGTGLGLFISTSIIEKHGGTLEIKSEVGRGTEIIVKLPLR